MLDYNEVYKKFEVSPKKWIVYTGPQPLGDYDAFVISLAKWRFKYTEDKYSNDNLYDGGIKTCGLCMLYHQRLPGRECDCSRCSIFKKTGCLGCENTPYYDATNEYDSDDYLDDWDTFMEVHLEAVKEEIKFLIDLFRSLFPNLPVPGGEDVP